MENLEGNIRSLRDGDYDMLLTERLVEGVDVWLNTPRRPWEASGTSGMKTLVNGGLNSALGLRSSEMWQTPRPQS
jgi:glucan phosphorylase